MKRLALLAICIFTPTILIGAAAAGAGAGKIYVEHRTLPQQVEDVINNALSIIGTLTESLQDDIQKFQKQLGALDNDPHFKKLNAAQQKNIKSDIQAKIKRLIDMAQKLETISLEELEHDQA